jgi:hypothetical protein
MLHDGHEVLLPINTPQEVEALGDKLAASVPYEINIIRAEMYRTPLLEYAADTLSVRLNSLTLETGIVHPSSASALPSVRDCPGSHSS